MGVVSKHSAGAKAKAKAKANRLYTREQLVQKKILDNFKSWGSVDTDLRQVRGLTLRQTLLRDIEANEAGKEPKVMGGLYYQKLRELFKPPTTPSEALKVADASLAIDPRLVAAVVAAKRQHPDRTAMSAWMQTSTKPNQSEIVGVFRFFLSLKSRCSKQLVVGLDALRFIARLKLDAEFPTEFAVIRSWCDDILEQTLVRSRANHTPDDVFVELHKPVLSLIMQSDDLTKVVAGRKNILEVDAQISRLVASSQTGLRLFASMIEGVLDAKVEKIITIAVDDCFGPARKHTADTLLADQLACQREVENMNCIDLLPKRRLVNMRYREQMITVRVLSTQEQVQLAWACATKSVGVETKQLCELWVESMLVPETSKCRWKCKLPDNIYAGAAAARARLRQAINDANAATGDLVQHTLAKATPDLMLTDPTFKVEIAIVEELCSERCAQRVLNAVLDCLPSIDKAIEPETSAQKLHAVATSNWYQLADRSAQEKVKVVQTLINSLVDHRAPDLSEVGKSTFLAPVVTRLQFFVRKGNSIGVDALGKILDEVIEKSTAGTATVGEVLPLVTYKFLFDAIDERRAKAEAVVRAVEEKWKGDIGESMRKRQRTKASTPAASSSTGEVDRAMRVCLDMFK